MTDNPSVNRYLVDKAMDAIDHALGRPVDPMRESYRNRFVANGDKADEMAKSFAWKEYPYMSGMKVFAVTDAGRAALTQHLKEIGDKHRAFDVTYRHHTSTYPAVSHNKARYQAWLAYSDCYPDLAFIDFARGSTVRLARLQ